MNADETNNIEHDFSTAKRGAVLSNEGKTRITIYLDNDVLAHFRKIANINGRGYQTEINNCLRAMTQGSASRHLVQGASLRGSNITILDIDMKGGRAFPIKELALLRENLRIAARSPLGIDDERAARVRARRPKERLA